MTLDERLNRIEHIAAGLAEHGRKDQEESRQLWRDTQRQIKELGARLNDLTVKVADTNDAVARLPVDTNKAITRLADEARVADRHLEQRVDSLVSAIGEWLRTRNGGTH